MDAPIQRHLDRTYFAEYQLLRTELVRSLSDDDLAFRPAASLASLGELCREIGEIEHSYIEALRTFRQDFGWRNPDQRVSLHVALLAAWYEDLDLELRSVLDGLTEDDIANRRISRDDAGVDDFAPLPEHELHLYQEALVIFYGKVSIYLRLMGKVLPGHWPDWIG